MASAGVAEVSKIGAAIGANPEWYALVCQADQWVREILGKYETGKDLTWELTSRRPGGSPVFQLALTTSGRSVTGELTLDEITNRREVRWKAIQLWGQLTDRQLKDEFREIHHLLTELRVEMADGR